MVPPSTMGTGLNDGLETNQSQGHVFWNCWETEACAFTAPFGLLPSRRMRSWLSQEPRITFENETNAREGRAERRKLNPVTVIHTLDWTFQLYKQISSLFKKMLILYRFIFTTKIVLIVTHTQFLQVSNFRANECFSIKSHILPSLA